MSLVVLMFINHEPQESHENYFYCSENIIFNLKICQIFWVLSFLYRMSRHTKNFN